MPETARQFSVLVPCDDCGAPRGHLEECGGNEVCPDCAESYRPCADCDELTHEDQLCGTGLRRLVCESCLENYGSCDDCGDSCHIDDMVTIRDSYSVCNGCADSYYTCDECGDLFHESDLEDGACSNCRESYYSWSPTPVPPSEGRRFGVELETSECEDYQEIKHQTVFGAHDDCSISGKEFVSPVLQYPSGLDYVSTFCQRARHFSVDAKCGFHLHVEISDLTLEQRKNIARAYLATYSLWASLVPRSRRENRFCAPSEYVPESVNAIESESDWRRFCDNNGRSRAYYWANWGAFSHHGTLEIRLHTASLNYGKIASWVSAHVQFIEATKDGFAFSNDLWSDFKRIWPSDLVSYYRQRAKRFAK